MKLLTFSLLAGVLYGLAGSLSAQVLFVVNNESNVISQITLDGVVSPAIETLLDSPARLAIDAAGNLAVGNSGSQTVVIYRPVPEVRSVSGSVGGLAFDGAGNLFFGQTSGTPVIYKLTPGGELSEFSTIIASPHGLASDAGGNLYVAGSVPNEIIKLTPDGTPSAFAISNELAMTRGLAFDSSGFLYASNPLGNSILKISPDGSLVNVFASGGTLADPEGLAFDLVGNLYATNAANGTVTKITPGGEQSVFVTGLSTPVGIVFSPVPEPQTFAFLSLAAMGWALWRFRR